MTNTDKFRKNNEAYEKMVEAVQSLDFERLNDLYTKRRDGFLKEAKESTHQEFTTRSLYAIISTDVCMEVFYDFLLAMGEKIKKISEKAEQDLIEHKTSANESLDKLRELLQEIESQKNEEVTEDYTDFAKSRQAIYTQVFNSQQELAVFKSSTNTISIFLVTLSGTSTYGSLTKLFEITDLSLVGEVMIWVLQTLAGLIPVAGTAGTALWGLYDIYDRRAKQYKKAGDILTQLDNYSEVAFSWCTITQMMIELHKGNLSIQDNDDFDDDDDDNSGIEKMVSEQEIERISKIIQEKIEGHVKKYTGESG